MSFKILNFCSLILLLNLAREDLRSRQVGLYKILLLSLISWLQWLSQAGGSQSFGLAMASSLVFCLLLVLVEVLEKAQGRFYLGPADLLVLAALAPQAGLWSCLVLAALASAFCLISMGLLALATHYYPCQKTKPTKKGQDGLALPLLPFYCLAWLLLPLIT